MASASGPLPTAPLVRPKYHRPNRARSAVVVSAVLLAVIIGGLLWMNYKSHRVVRQAAGQQYIQEAERIADSLSYFFSERRGDMRDLAGSYELSVYFENKALGMSLEYGLRAGLTAISEKLIQMLTQERIHGDPIYERIVFIDRDGHLLASAPEIGALSDSDLSVLLKSEEVEPCILQENGKNLLRPVLSLAYYYKNRYEGQIIAWLSRDLLGKQLLKPESGLSQRSYGLMAQDGHLFLNMISDSPMPIHFIPRSGKKDDEPAGLETGTLTDDPSGITFVLARLPVKDTPYDFLMAAPEVEIYGRTQPRHLTFVLGIMAALVIGTTIILWRANTHNMVLFARLEETRKRESAIHSKNIELEKEIGKRRSAEQELKQYQQNLEHLVEARTTALNQAQKELVTKAIEAGRAQLSGMVLHNIGNAVTPIVVLLDSIKTAQIEEITFFLEKCHQEISKSLVVFSAYLQNNPRTKEVLDYQGQLIAGLKQDLERHRVAESKIGEAVAYIAEILTMQQNYAAAEQEIKSVVDVNRLLHDAIHMQTSALEKRGIVVIDRLSPQLPKLIIDRNRLMQMVVNIIKNGYEAIDQHKYPPEKTMIFESFACNGRVGFAISDTGIGVAAGDAEHLFAFGRSGKGSSGFGLYYCKMFVEANQGCLTIESSGPGQGATVRVWFDRTQDDKMKVEI